MPTLSLNFSLHSAYFLLWSEGEEDYAGFAQWGADSGFCGGLSDSERQRRG